MVIDFEVIDCLPVPVPPEKVKERFSTARFAALLLQEPKLRNYARQKFGGCVMKGEQLLGVRVLLVLEQNVNRVFHAGLQCVLR
jgi:hypothetical protein